MSVENSKNTKAIITSAIDLFQEKGYENVSVQEICNRSGVSRSSFYSIFSGKSDILSTMINGIRLNFDKMVPDFIKAESDVDRIWLITDSYLSLAARYGPQLIKALYIEELSGQHQFLSDIEKYTDWIIPLVRNCQKTGTFQNKSDPEKIVKIQFDLCKGILVDWVLNEGNFNLEDRVYTMFKALWMIKE